MSEPRQLLTHKWQAEKPQTAKRHSLILTLAVAATMHSLVPPTSIGYINLRRRDISVEEEKTETLLSKYLEAHRQSEDPKNTSGALLSLSLWSFQGYATMIGTVPYRTVR